MQPPSRTKPYDDLAGAGLYFVVGAERAANNVIRSVARGEGVVHACVCVCVCVWS
jgi:hypothetical protein